MRSGFFSTKSLNPMSCNGCRVLRKGCSDTCILRPCLQWIESAEAQGHATVFVAKFFGRAGLMSFISSVPDAQRPALFQSLLFEACGRTVNPVNGAVGLLWTGNWHVCQAAVETVLRGGALRPIPELLAGGSAPPLASDEASDICTDMWRSPCQDGSPNDNSTHHCRFSRSKSATEKRKRQRPDVSSDSNLDLHLNHGLPPTAPTPCKAVTGDQPGTPSMISEESVTTSCWEAGFSDQYVNGGEKKLLNLFV